VDYWRGRRTAERIDGQRGSLETGQAAAQLSCWPLAARSLIYRRNGYLYCYTRRRSGSAICCCDREINAARRPPAFRSALGGSIGVIHAGRRRRRRRRIVVVRSTRAPTGPRCTRYDRAVRPTDPVTSRRASPDDSLSSHLRLPPV